MERRNNKLCVFFLKMLKILLPPITRLRKFMRKSNTRQIKIFVGFVVIISFIATVSYLYRLSKAHRNIQQTTSSYLIGTPLKHVPLDEVYKDIWKTEDKNYILDLEEQHEQAAMLGTPGCKIPVAMLDYEKYITHKNSKFLCGKRAIFLSKIDDSKVIARIKTRIFEKYTTKSKLFECCHQFIIDSIQLAHPRLSNCTKFQDESIITLQSDFIKVVCSVYDANNKSQIIYDDMYAFSKKKNISKPKTKTCQFRYNVLMIGMDSMSLPRAVKTLPRTIALFNNDNWLGLRGYHKIADNTFPNLMAALTGKNMSVMIEKCYGKMDDCKDLLIWNTFKEVGYVTAYGEDYIKLPDTFTREYELSAPPTDHYLRPFFLKGEAKKQNNSLLCTGKALSGKQVLDYALDFVNTYKKDAFFGFFWINSLSHDVKSHPEDADLILENFVNQLAYTGALMRTFIIFFSDHGIRFGGLRFKMESYYDNRMPMNFMWIPLIFKGMHPYELRAIAINQFRLVTPYDMYSTLLDIKKVSLCSNISGPVPGGCQNCHSLFNVITSNRTCKDVDIHDKWCSCHKLYPLPIQDPIGVKSVDLVVNHIKNMIKTIETLRCWDCMSVSLKTIVRIHFYYNKDKISLFYVAAFTMTPGNVTYEATVLRKDTGEFSIVGPISVISNYRGLGKCTLNRRDRLFCICQKIDNC